jgi:hypothetical protein
MAGPTQRLDLVRTTFEHLPCWRCFSFTKGLFYLCGKCFAKLGDGPATNAAEIWMAGTDREGVQHPEVVPLNADCQVCGGHAWAKD